jgi:hypothetical protein
MGQSRVIARQSNPDARAAWPISLSIQTMLFIAEPHEFAIPLAAAIVFAATSRAAAGRIARRAAAMGALFAPLVVLRLVFGTPAEVGALALFYARTIAAVVVADVLVLRYTEAGIRSAVTWWLLPIGRAHAESAGRSIAEFLYVLSRLRLSFAGVGLGMRLRSPARRARRRGEALRRVSRWFRVAWPILGSTVDAVETGVCAKGGFPRFHAPPAPTYVFVVAALCAGAPVVLAIL